MLWHHQVNDSLPVIWKGFGVQETKRAGESCRLPRVFGERERKTPPKHSNDHDLPTLAYNLGYFRCSECALMPSSKYTFGGAMKLLRCPSSETNRQTTPTTTSGRSARGWKTTRTSFRSLGCVQRSRIRSSPAWAPQHSSCRWKKMEASATSSKHVLGVLG